jgi:hypothetical protein
MMGVPSNPEVSFHRTAENNLAARVDDRSMIALPRSGGGLCIWSAYRIDKEPGQWTRGDFFIVGGTVDGEDGFRAHVLEIAEHKREARRLLRAQIQSGGHTPWGEAQASYHYGEGIVCHSTAGHGGFHLDERVNARVHPAWRSPTAFYEEDVEWSIVAVTYPNLFTTYERKCADETLRHFRPDAYEAINAVTLLPGESRMKDERQFRTDHAGDWIVISTITSSHEPGFVECVATPGGDRRSHRERWFLVPSDEYEPERFGFVIDEERHRSYDGPSDFAGVR